MTNPLPVPAGRLRGRTVRFLDQSVPGVSLFPFFDRGGEVRQVMIVLSDSQELYLLGWGPHRFRVPVWDAVIVRQELVTLRRIGPTPLQAIDGLLHYDPWWTLDDDRYANHPARRWLKASNCANELPQNLSKVWYRRDLARLRWVTIREDNNIAIKSWPKDMLPERPKAKTSLPAESTGQRITWRHDPIWMR